MSTAKLPASPAAMQQALMWRVLRLGYWLATATVLAFALAYWQRGQTLLTSIEVVGALAMSAGYLVARRRRNPAIGVQVIGVVAWLLLAVVITVSGGLRSPALSWILLLAPLLMLAGGRLALAMTVATVVLTGALYLADRLHWLPAHVEVPIGQRALSAALIAALFSIFAGYALRWRVRLAEELTAARDAAIEAMRLRDRFIANLNHEIRTPMNALVAGARQLGRQPLAGEQRELVRAMQRSADHLLELVNDVLDHARLEAGAVRLDPRPFSLRELARGALEIFRAAAQDKAIALRLDIEPGLHDRWTGEPTRLRQILGNLLSNAVKFTPAGGDVGLHIGAATLGSGDSALCFEVQDNGPGIPASVQARLFEPYEQGDASITRRFGGTGLGLSICRELLRLMNGSIEVDSTPGRGCCFRVVVPLPRDEGHAPPSTLPGELWPASGPATTVLLVEDDATNRMVMEAELRDLGVAVVCANGGEEALALLALEPIDLVLMDCQMPELDGLAATRRWRSQEARQQHQRVPVIALTGESHAEARAACLAAGMDDYLQKPASTKALRAVLARWAPLAVNDAAVDPAVSDAAG